MSDSVLRYWHTLDAIIPVKVEFVEAGLASGLPRAADRHGHSLASSLGRRSDTKDASPPIPQPSRHRTARGTPRTTMQRRDLSRQQTLYYADAGT